MLACGQGFADLDWAKDPALKAFLLEQRPVLRCGDLGARGRGATAARLTKIGWVAGEQQGRE